MSASAKSGARPAAKSAVKTIPLTSHEQWLKSRDGFIGASEIACLFGIHPYVTPYGLFGRKTGRLPPTEETPAMRRGKRLEAVALDIVSEDNPTWAIHLNPVPGGVMYADAAARMAATPDAIAQDPARGPGVIQVKSVSPRTYRREWRDADGGEIKLPLWIAVQASVEAHLTGAKWAAVAALVVDDAIDCHVIEVPLLPGVIDRLKAEAAAFWTLVEAGTPPEADYGRDLDLIKHMNTAVQPGLIADLDGDNEFIAAAADHAACAADLKLLKSRQERAEAIIRDKLGAAEAARAGDWFITNKLINRKAYEVKAGSYRSLRISQQRQAEAA